MIQALFYAGGGVVAAAGLVLLVRALFADRARGRERCPKCWYDLTGSGGATGAGRIACCPECGRVTKRPRAKRRTRRHWRRALLAIVVILAGLALVATPKAQRDGWESLVPTTVLILFLDTHTTWALDALKPRISTGSTVMHWRADPGALADWQWKLFARRMGRAIAREPGGSVRWFVLADAPHAELAALPIAAAIDRRLDDRDPESAAAREALLIHLARVAAKTGDHAVRTAIIGTLTRAVSSDDDALRLAAAGHLGLQWREAREAVPALADLAIDESAPARARCVALTAIERIGPHGPAAAEPLVRLVSGPERDPAVLAHAVIALGAVARETGPEHDAVVDALARLLRDPAQQWFIRLQAGRGLRPHGAYAHEVSALWREMVEIEPAVDAVLHEIAREPVLGDDAATVFRVFESAARPENIRFAAHILLERGGAHPFRARLGELVSDPDPVRAAEARMLIEAIDRAP